MRLRKQLKQRSGVGISKADGSSNRTKNPTSVSGGDEGRDAEVAAFLLEVIGSSNRTKNPTSVSGGDEGRDAELAAFLSEVMQQNDDPVVVAAIQRQMEATQAEKECRNDDDSEASFLTKMKETGVYSAFKSFERNAIRLVACEDNENPCTCIFDDITKSPLFDDNDADDERRAISRMDRNATFDTEDESLEVSIEEAKRRQEAEGRDEAEGREEAEGVEEVLVLDNLSEAKAKAATVVSSLDDAAKAEAEAKEKATAVVSSVTREDDDSSVSVGSVMAGAAAALGLEAAVAAKNSEEASIPPPPPDGNSGSGYVTAMTRCSVDDWIGTKPTIDEVEDDVEPKLHVGKKTHENANRMGAVNAETSEAYEQIPIQLTKFIELASQSVDAIEKAVDTVFDTIEADTKKIDTAFIDQFYERINAPTLESPDDSSANDGNEDSSDDAGQPSCKEVGNVTEDSENADNVTAGPPPMDDGDNNNNKGAAKTKQTLDRDDKKSNEKVRSSSRISTPSAATKGKIVKKEVPPPPFFASDREGKGQKVQPPPFFASDRDDKKQKDVNMKKIERKPMEKDAKMNTWKVEGKSKEILDDANKNKTMENNNGADNEPTKEVGLAIHVEHKSDTPDGLTVALVRVRKVQSIND